MASQNKETMDKWSRLRQVAAEEPKEADSALAEVADALGTMSDALSNLRENLDLIEAPKTASIKVRIATARKYATSFRNIATDAPEVVADAISEVYHSLDDVAGAIETLAENLGIDLELTPAEEAFAEEGKEELAGELPEETGEPKIDENEFEEGKEDLESSEAKPAEEAFDEASKNASKKTAGPLMEKMIPGKDTGLGESGPLGALRKVLYMLDGSYTKPQILGLVEKTLTDMGHDRGVTASKRKKADDTQYIDAAIADMKEKNELSSVLDFIDMTPMEQQAIFARARELKAKAEGMDVYASAKEGTWDESAAGVGKPAAKPCSDFEGHAKTNGKCWNCRRDYQEHSEAGVGKSAAAKFYTESLASKVSVKNPRMYDPEYIESRQQVHLPLPACSNFEGHAKTNGKCWNCGRDYQEHSEGKPKKADAGFVTDRDSNAKPETPEKAEIPEAQGKTEVGKAASREITRQRIAKRHGITL
jgi:hypothetical protein